MYIHMFLSTVFRSNHSAHSVVKVIDNGLNIVNEDPIVPTCSAIIIDLFLHLLKENLGFHERRISRLFEQVGTSQSGRR